MNKNSNIIEMKSWKVTGVQHKLTLQTLFIPQSNLRGEKETKICHFS